MHVKIYYFRTQFRSFGFADLEKKQGIILHQINFIMIKTSLFLLANMLASAAASGQANSHKYILVHVVLEDAPHKHARYKIAKVNKKDINRLNEPLKALGAYYCCRAGSNCDIDDQHNEVCELTTAFGLGEQGSDQHINILKKWFRNDPETSTSIKQHCFLSISGSNYFSDFDKLVFTTRHDTVNINYKIGYYRRGNSTSRKFNDIAIIKKNEIKFIKREFW